MFNIKHDDSAINNKDVDYLKCFLKTLFKGLYAKINDAVNYDSKKA